MIGRRRDALDEIGDEGAALIEILAQVIAFARSHGVEIGQGVGDRQRGADGQFLVGGLVGRALALADGQRLRQPQQIARGQRAGDQTALARLIDRRRQRGAERLVELDLDRRRLPELQRDAELDPPARHPLADQRAHLGLDRRQRLRDPHLQVQVAMVQRPDRHRDRRALVLAGHGRKAGHALDHG